MKSLLNWHKQDNNDNNNDGYEINLTLQLVNEFECELDLPVIQITMSKGRTVRTEERTCSSNYRRVCAYS